MSVCTIFLDVIARFTKIGKMLENNLFNTVIIKANLILNHIKSAIKSTIAPVYNVENPVNCIALVYYNSVIYLQAVI